VTDTSKAPGSSDAFLIFRKTLMSSNIVEETSPIAALLDEGALVENL
jgi:hypothetical protein